MKPHAVEINGLSKLYHVGASVSYRRLTESIYDGVRTLARRRGESQRTRDELWALRDISLTIECGEAVGLIGRNGAGKSTLLKILSRITEPTSGSARLRGRVGALLEVGTGFHPELTGRENIYLNGVILGMRRQEIARRFDEIVAFAGVERFLDTPVKRYSSGMGVRLGFAVAAHLEPEILLVDEVLAVGDVAFQRKCLGKMEEVAGDGRTVLFVSHNMATIQALCERAYLLDGGRVVEQGSAREVVGAYLSVMSSTVAVPLDEREDRRGDASARITSLTVESAEGDYAIRVGSRLRVTVAYRGAGPLSHPRFCVSVYDSTRTGIYMLDSEVAEPALEGLAAEGQVVCYTAPILVTAGRCYVNVSLFKSSVLADYVDNAGVFDVEESDPLGLGRIPPREWAVHMIDQVWSVDDARARSAADRFAPLPPGR